MEGLTKTVSGRLTADAEDVRFAPSGLNKGARRISQQIVQRDGLPFED